jgi:DNA-directed RNA polymerase beta subunit
MYRLSSIDYQILAEKFDSLGDYKIADYYDKQLKFAQTKLPPEVEQALQRQEKVKKTTRQKVFDAGFGAMEASSALGAKKGIKHAYDLAAKAKSNPELAKKAGWLANWITTKVPKLAFVAKSLPFLGVIIHLAFSYPVIMRYINLIQQGKFEKEIWADPTERATFIEQCMMLLAGFIMAPPANAIPGFTAAGTAMYAFASAISLGKKGIEYGLRATGELDENKEELAAQAGLTLESQNFETLLAVYDPKVQNVLKNIVVGMFETNPNLRVIEVINNPRIANLDFVKNQSLNTRNNLLATQLKEGIAMIQKAAKEEAKENGVKTQAKPRVQNALRPAKNNDYYIGYGYSAFQKTKDQQRALNAMRHEMMQDNITPANKQLIIKGFFDMFKSYKQKAV